MLCAGFDGRIDQIDIVSFCYQFLINAIFDISFSLLLFSPVYQGYLSFISYAELIFLFVIVRNDHQCQIYTFPNLTIL